MEEWDESTKETKFLVFLQTFSEFEFEEKINKNSENSSNIQFQKPSILKTFFIVSFSVLSVMIIFYSCFALLGIFHISRPIVQARAATQPFFSQMHRSLIDDNFDGTVKYSRLPRITVHMFYSPYSFSSKHFRGKYYRIAKMMRTRHPNFFPYFGAVNCFDSGGKCKSLYKIAKFPILMATSYQKLASIYNGPLDEQYVVRWLNRLQNPVYRISVFEDLLDLLEIHNIAVIIFIRFKNERLDSAILKNYTSASFQHFDGDPNSETTIFCVVTDEALAKSYQLNNEYDLVFVNTEFKVIFTGSLLNLSVEKLTATVDEISDKENEDKVEILNYGSTAFASTQLSEKLYKDSILLYITKNVSINNSQYLMLKEIANDYNKCDSHFLENKILDSEVSSCTDGIVSYSCQRNSTLKFIMADSVINMQLALKFGAIKEDMIIIINSEQEIVKFFVGNVTKSTINCLIHQHHETAENQFITESSQLVKHRQNKFEYGGEDDAVGQSSYIREINSFEDLRDSTKNLVVLFSGGVWHTASSSVIAALHQASDYFSNVRNQLEFVKIDVSKTSVPYNFDFDKLPKVLVTAANSTSTSWPYPEELPINYANVVRFVTSRPSLQLRTISFLNSCDSNCLMRSQLRLRAERTTVRRALNRHKIINPKKRQRLVRLNWVLNIIQQHAKSLEF